MYRIHQVKVQIHLNKLLKLKKAKRLPYSANPQTDEQVAFYLENARIINEGLKSLGIITFGGGNAPYVWLKTPGGISSWDFFDKLLNECHVVGTPGSGFGPAGEGFFRLSAFGHRENVEKAVSSIKEKLQI